MEPLFLFLTGFFFLQQILHEFHHLHQGVMIKLGRGWIYHLRFSLFYGMGAPLFFTSLVGLVWNFLKNPKQSLFLFSFPLTYYIVAGVGYTVYVRYMLIVVLFLNIAAAKVLEDFSNFFVSFLAKRSLNVKPFFVLLLVSIMVVLPGLKRAIKFDYFLGKTDNRLIVSKWIETHLAPRTKIGLWASYWGKPILKNRFLIYHYDPQTNSFIPLQKPTKSRCCLPEYLIVEEYPLLVYSHIPASLLKLIKNYYIPIKYFKAIDPRQKSNLFDQQDAFYLPFAGFCKVRRPGPNFIIYKLKN